MKLRLNTLSMAICSALLLSTGYTTSHAVAQAQDSEINASNSNEIAKLVLTSEQQLDYMNSSDAGYDVEGDALTLDFDAISEEEANSKWPNVKIAAPEGTWDWNTKGGLRFTFENPSDQPIRFEIKLADNLGIMGAATHQLDLPVEMDANSTETIDFYFLGSQMQIPGYRGGDELDLRNLAELQFYAVGPIGEQVVKVHDVEFIAGTGDLVKSEVLAEVIVADGVPTIAEAVTFKPGKQEVIELHTGSEIEVIKRDEGHGLKVHYGTEEAYPTVKFAPKKPFDWSGHGDFALAFDLDNIGDSTATLFIRVDDAIDEKFGGTASGVVNSRTGYFQLPKGESGTYYFTMSEANKLLDPGMRGLPPRKSYAAQQVGLAWGEQELDASNIVSIQLYMMEPAEEATIVIDSLRLIPNLSNDTSRFAGLIDQYGQYAETDWPEKVHDDEELAARAKADLELIANAKLADDRAKFGGWKDGPKLEGTGFFRTEKVDGKWAFVDPEGYLYFATGLDNIRMDDTFTTTGRAFTDYAGFDHASFRPSEISDVPYLEETKERAVMSELRHSMFNWLPEFDDALAQNFQYAPTMHAGPLNHGEVFSFYGANLQRKFNPESFEKASETWHDLVIARMMDWGFSSLGNWSNPSFYSNDKIPYTAHGWITGGHKRIVTGNDYWGPLHDPFDPVFRDSVKATAQSVAAEVNNSPWCIGVFIDNELTWGNTAFEANHYSLATGALRADAAESPAKAHFVATLKAKYKKIGALNKAWGSDAESWDAFAKGFTFDGNYNDASRADFSQFLTDVAEEFFSIVQQEVKEAMPNHLYMGARFSVWGMTPEAIDAAAKFTDVMSYNQYATDLYAKGDWSMLERHDKPAFIGEFAFGATDSGMFHPGPMGGDTQEWRGESYVHFLESIVENPYFVGAHWFQYLDSPTTGRAWDGENYNNGFVTVTDTPYETLVEYARDTHKDLYQRRFGK
ncbi:beta-galactosidase [Aliagarivorans taiwanensis]|uniref:beta-galactosidase n=1 Tax=Aliagarivorans taiwanensis TaxID=561966 RepID=UPI00040933B6|nr:beta-galactosidase [Aliagarivorans taiwanensis]